MGRRCGNNGLKVWYKAGNPFVLILSTAVPFHGSGGFFIGVTQRPRDTGRCGVKGGHESEDRGQMTDIGCLNDLV